MELTVMFVCALVWTAIILMVLTALGLLKPVRPNNSEHVRYVTPDAHISNDSPDRCAYRKAIANKIDRQV